MLEHKFKRCTIEYNDPHSTCRGCSDDGQDCLYEALSICAVCGGMEGSLLPECPGHMLTPEEDKENYAHYCAGTGPFNGVPR